MEVGKAKLYCTSVSRYTVRPFADGGRWSPRGLSVSRPAKRVTLSEQSAGSEGSKVPNAGAQDHQAWNSQPIEMQVGFHRRAAGCCPDLPGKACCMDSRAEKVFQAGARPHALPTRSSHHARWPVWLPAAGKEEQLTETLMSRPKQMAYRRLLYCDLHHHIAPAQPFHRSNCALWAPGKQPALLA